MHERARERERLTVVVAGHVDHGKSTLVGRLVAECGGLGPARMEQVRERCRRAGRPFEYAFLVDALASEQAQGITLDAARVFVQTDEREYLIVDAPGHAELVRNMATGASRADAALLVVDAAEGVRETTRRHAELLALLGVRHLAVAVNKMDRAGYAHGPFETIVAELSACLERLGLRASAFVPCSGANGEQVASRGEALAWHTGPTVLEALEAFPRAAMDGEGPFRLPVQDVLRGGDRRLVAGTVESGCVRVGDELAFSPSNVRARVEAIETPRGAVESAGAGEAVGLALDRPAFVERGETAASAARPVARAARRVRAVVVWLGESPLAAGAELVFRSGTKSAAARVEEIRRTVGLADVTSPAKGHAPPTELGANAVGECVLALAEPFPVEPAAAWPGAGRFVLVVDGRVHGGGTVQEVLADGGAAAALSGSRGEGAVIWFTGLSGAGKTTVAEAVARRLEAEGRAVERLDGDEIRRLFPGTGFDRAAREEHVRRIGFTAGRLEKHGVIALVSLVSPYAASRDFARAQSRRFVEVHVSTPLAECERRDVKGLYAKARRGEIRGFTGIDDPYERPASPELEIDTTGLPVEEAAERVLRAAGLAATPPPETSAAAADGGAPARNGANGRVAAAPPALRRAERLDLLEARSIHVLREARATVRNLGMLWSIGKDSTVMVWLARKAFFGRVPFPLIHVDTGFKIPEMIAYRDRLAREWGLDILYGKNEAALAAKQTFPDGAVDRIACCRTLKTDALRRTLTGEGVRYRMGADGTWAPDPDRAPFTGVIVGLRADEEGSRSKERYFSPRAAGGTWRVEAQPPELWNLYNTDVPPGTHLRVHPLLDWTELDIWEYIAREKIPTVSLYYAGADGRRYRSLGCAPCTNPIPSSASTPEEIVAELRTGALRDVPERSGRAQDTEDGGGLETLRRGGYM